MQLIIAEKPSLGRNIVAAIQSGKKDTLVRRNGYFEGKQYLVTWAFGHLFSLCDIEYYNPSPRGDNRWCMENLPCFPKQFAFQLRQEQGHTDDGVEKQFALIRSLCNREDVDTLINAGDADREGEIIVRLCLEHAMTPEALAKKQQRRLWLPDQTPQTVLAALETLPPAQNYELLAREGYARTYIDWLYGVNLTRYATLRSGSFLRVGRVIVPIVQAIYDRDMAIRNFVSDTYYSLSSCAQTNGEKVELNSKVKFEKSPDLPPDAADAAAQSEALQKAAFYNAGGAKVVSVKRKKDKIAPGKLYSLTKLQNALGKKYKMPMEQSLAVLQKLYEAGYVTYPRTNSEYLATAEKDKIRKIIDGVRTMGYPVVFKEGKNIFDDSKIESHSALTPTYKLPDKNALTEDEKKVYGMIIRRFAAVFCEKDCIADKTEITVDVAGGGDGSPGKGETFVLKGTIIREPGWTKYDDYNGRDKILPALKEGDEVAVDFAPVAKETSPPKHYTIETLNNYLKNPFKEDKARAAAAQKARAEDDEDSEGDDSEDYRAIFEGLELGTEATRTGIIDNARKSKYIQLKKDVYTILPAGEVLIESLRRMGIVMDKYKTAQMGRALKQVYRGEISVEDSVQLAQEEIRHVFELTATPAPPEQDTDDGCMGDVIGVCPLCKKGEVRRTAFGYGCSAWQNGCKFTIRGVICDRVISKSNAALIITTGKSAKIQGFVSKRTGKAFDATLVLQPDGKLHFDFS